MEKDQCKKRKRPWPRKTVMDSMHSPQVKEGKEGVESWGGGGGGGGGDGERCMKDGREQHGREVIDWRSPALPWVELRNRPDRGRRGRLFRGAGRMGSICLRSERLTQVRRDEKRAP